MRLWKDVPEGGGVEGKEGGVEMEIMVLEMEWGSSDSVEGRKGRG